jgi:hemolysin III
MADDGARRGVCARIKEPFCGLSHLAGAALAVVGVAVLVALAWGKPWHIASFVIYGATLIALYTASGLYHSLHVPDERVEFWKRLDHAGIYLLIAGTYTPMCLVALRGSWGYTILGIEWGLATFGVIATLLLKRVPNVVRVTLYLLMGWLIVVAMPAVRAVLPDSAVLWLAAGGVIYTLGTVIYALDKPNLWPGRFSAHDLWHVFVLAGSACHYVLMAVFIARLG